MVIITKLGKNRVDCVYSLVPAIEYLTERYSCHCFSRTSINEFVVLNGYTYYFRLHSHNVFFSRWIGEEDIGNRKKDVVVENGLLQRHIQHTLRVLTFPIKNGSDIPLGLFNLLHYKYRTLKCNYCIHCDKYHPRINQHLNSKKHKQQIHLLIDDILIKDLNDDIINYICGYL